MKLSPQTRPGPNWCCSCLAQRWSRTAATSCSRTSSTKVTPGQDRRGISDSTRVAAAVGRPRRNPCAYARWRCRAPADSARPAGPTRWSGARRHGPVWRAATSASRAVALPAVADFLGVIQGGVGGVQQRLLRLAVLRIDRHPDAARHHDLAPVNGQWRAATPQQDSGSRVGIFRVGEIGNDDRKLVATETGHKIDSPSTIATSNKLASLSNASRARSHEMRRRAPRLRRPIRSRP